MTSYFPEDVVIEILVRIPAHQLLKLRGVCRKWKDLISAQYFKDRHTNLNRSKEHDSSSMFLFGSNRSFKNKDSILGNHQLMIIDNWEQPGSKPIFLEGIPKPDSEEDNLRYGTMINLCSFSGFVVMDYEIDQVRGRHGWMMDQVRNYGKIDCAFIICNPITGENMIIDVSKTRHRFWALFFNPQIMEYCVILNKFSGDDDGDSDEFEMLNLGSQPCCKPLKSPKSLPRQSHFIVHGHPLVLDNANIYWLLRYTACEQLILVFNILAKEFSFLPHPHPHSLYGCHMVRKHENMHIINIHGGLLSFVQIEITFTFAIFNIWTLNMKYSKPNWIRTHNIIIPVCKFSFDRSPSLLSLVLKVLTIRNEEMLFQDTEIGIVYAYNLELGTLRLIWKYDRKMLCSNLEFLSYVPTFVSLKNCPSIISIEEEDYFL